MARHDLARDGSSGSGGTHHHPRTIEAYLDTLRSQLVGSDPALIQDALAGAEEHLRHHLNELGPRAEEESMMRQAMETYGTPEEIAEAYLGSEAQAATLAASPTPERALGLGAKIFGVLTDPHAYGALFYFFLSLATGIVYFTWAVTGLSLSLGLSILIIGLPFTLLFLATVRVISLVEGRIVEGLLGERMPRRPLFNGMEGTVIERIKTWLTDGHTWSTLGYMLLMLPLGLIYFVLFTFILSLSLGLMAAPVAQLVFDFPIITFFDQSYELPLALMPVMVLAGFADLILGLHLARALGQMQARLAKKMLVST